MTIPSLDQALALWSNLSLCVFMMINNASCHTNMYTEQKLSKTTTTSLLFMKIYTANPIEVLLKSDSIECHLTFNIGDDLCSLPIYISGSMQNYVGVFVRLAKYHITA